MSVISKFYCGQQYVLKMLKGEYQAGLIFKYLWKTKLHPDTFRWITRLHSFISCRNSNNLSGKYPMINAFLNISVNRMSWFILALFMLLKFRLKYIPSTFSIKYLLELTHWSYCAKSTNTQCCLILNANYCYSFLAV